MTSTAHGAAMTYQYQYDDLGRLNTINVNGSSIITYGYDTASNIKSIAAMDSDGDGLKDADELAYYNTDPQRPDTDWDTMLDGWEVAHQLQPTVNDAALDADGDGFLNSEESASGTDPQAIPVVYVNGNAAAGGMAGHGRRLSLPSRTRCNTPD